MIGRRAAGAASPARHAGWKKRAAIALFPLPQKSG